MPTEVISTIRASGGDYPSLSAWEAAEQRNLVAADEVAVAECYNDWPAGLSDALVISGWTTDATRNVVIRTPPSERHTGIPGSGFWFGAPGWLNTTVDCASTYYNVIEGVEISHKFSAGSILNKWRGEVRDCILSNYGYPTAALNVSANDGIYINTLAIGVSTRLKGGFGHNYGSGAAGINCVAVNCDKGFDKGYPNHSRWYENCVAYDCPISFDNTSSSNNHNAASDATTVALPGSDNYPSDVTSADFVDAAANDFHLASGSGLATAGVNRYSTFTHDLDGDEYPSSGPWPIGFDYPTAATGSHDLTGTGATATTDTATGAVAQVHTLAGLSVAAQASATTDAITQGIALAGSHATTTADAVVGAVGVDHGLAGTGGQATAQAAVAAITQAHALTGPGALAATGADVSPLNQTHQLVADNASAMTDATSGAMGATGAFAGDNAESVSGATTGALGQVHALAGADADATTSATTGAIDTSGALTGQRAEATAAATTAAIIQLHSLGGDHATAPANATAGTIGAGQSLVGGDVESVSGATSAVIIQLHTLAAHNAESTADATTGAVVASGAMAGGDAEGRADATTAEIIQLHALIGTGATAVSDASVKALPGAGIGLVSATCLVDAESRLSIISATPERTIVWALDHCA